MVVRKLLDLIFSQHDLAWLDDILPDKDKKKKEDDKKKIKEKKTVEPESDEEVSESNTQSELVNKCLISLCVSPSAVSVLGLFSD